MLLKGSVTIMNRIKNLREKEEISQDQLAKILGVNLRTLQRWESGETSIRTKNATQLADYFGVSVGYLLGYEIKAEYSSFNGQEYQNELKKLAFSLAHLELLISDSQIKHLHALLKGMSHDNTLLNDVKTVKNKDKYYTEILKRNRDYNLLNEIKEDTELLEILKLLNEKL